MFDTARPGRLCGSTSPLGPAKKANHRGLALLRRQPLAGAICSTSTGDQYWDVRAGDGQDLQQSAAALKTVWTKPGVRPRRFRVQRPPSGMGGWLKERMPAGACCNDQPRRSGVGAPDGSGRHAPHARRRGRPHPASASYESRSRAGFGRSLCPHLLQRLTAGGRRSPVTPAPTLGFRAGARGGSAAPCLGPTRPSAASSRPAKAWRVCVHGFRVSNEFAGRARWRSGARGREGV